MPSYKKFTCGFFSNSLNFITYNLPTSRAQKDSIFTHLSNILERGYPTRPTHFLENILNDIEPSFSWQNIEGSNPTNLKVFEPYWDPVIKGNDEDSSYPALTFFKERIDQHLPEYSFIKNLLIPECKFEDILFTDPAKFNIPPNSAVDFFLPQADLVIEIDGPQHNVDPQKKIDRRREIALEKHGVATHRIPTKNIHENSDAMSRYFIALKKKLDANKEIQEIKVFLKLETPPFPKFSLELIAISRLQRLLVDFFENSESFDGKEIFEVKSDFNSEIDWPDIAIKDLENSYKIICEHHGSKINFPIKSVRLVDTFSESKDVKKIDLSVLKHNDASQKIIDTIYCFNALSNFNYLESPRDNSKKVFKIEKSEGVDHFKITSFPGLKGSLEKFNRTFLGLEDFRNGQFEIISAAVTNPAVLGLIPTGGGKSLCFQTLGIFEGGCQVIVCPITALIRDHVLELNKFGISERADYISSEKKGADAEYVLAKFKSGLLKFLFVSPEQFQKKEIRAQLRQLGERRLISRVIIDEVHCMSEWGHDFRTSYLNLASTIDSYLNAVPVMCLTATAALRVIEDIQIEFDISDDQVLYFMQDTRDELDFQLISDPNKLERLNEVIKNRVENDQLDNSKAFIVFSAIANDNTRRNRLGVDGISKYLRKQNSNLKIGIFTGKKPKNWVGNEEFEHIGIQNSERKDFAEYKSLVQKKYKENQVAGIIATKAFGMGVNKPNVRLTVHYGIPQSMEALYQEAGRAGRDKKKAECITIFTPEKKVPEDLHDPNSTLENIADIQNKMESQTKGGDLTQLLYFLTNSNKTIPQELEECLAELKSLRNLGSDGIFILSDEQLNEKGESGERPKEKVIFRLKQLGFISDWTVDFKSKQYEVIWKDQSLKELSSSILSTISKYTGDTSESLKKENEIEGILNSESPDKEAALIKVLLEWNYDHFVYQRRQSLKNVYEACENFKDPKQFKEQLENYFRVDKSFSTIGTILKSTPKDCISLVCGLLQNKNGNLVSQNKINNLNATILRYLESYQNNPGVNLLSALLRLQKNEFSNADGKQRFELFLDNFQTFSEFEPMLPELIKLISQFKPEVQEDGFDVIFDRFPNLKLANLVLDFAESNRAEKIVLEDVNRRLEALI